MDLISDGLQMTRQKSSCIKMLQKRSRHAGNRPKNCHTTCESFYYSKAFCSEMEVPTETARFIYRCQFRQY